MLESMITNREALKTTLGLRTFSTSKREQVEVDGVERTDKLEGV